MASVDTLAGEKKQQTSVSNCGINTRRSRKADSREIGLEIGSILGQYFLKLDYLHYGYWANGLAVDIASLRTAQENYADLLISHIPGGVSSILDVGCGTGQLAKKLADMGYEVDCVSPSHFLAEKARGLLGEKSQIFECPYEQMETEDRYDLILFSESFQYIDIERALEKTLILSNHDGYMLICDFFKKDTPWKSMISGGHWLKTFYDIVSKYPLKIVKDLDITDETAPTIDVVDDVFKKAVHPAAILTQQLLDSRYPLMSKLLRWAYRKRIDKINRTYFDGEKTAENFKKFKSYRLLLFKKASSA